MSETHNFAKLPLAIFIIPIICLIVGCNPIFVTQAVIEEAKILAARQPIDELLQDSDTPAPLKSKLELVQRARLFAQNQLKLKIKGNFDSYAKISRSPLLWVLTAAPPDSLESYTWWFPIVGSIPYKGFFSKDSAQRAADRLKAQGLEVSLRGSSAFSTLGWFDDPILSSTLENPDYFVALTVIHELVHSTLWISDDAHFNESLAHYTSLQASLEFFANDPKMQSFSLDYLNQELYLSKRIHELVSALNKLFDNKPNNWKEIKAKLYLKAASGKYEFPELHEPNNANLTQLYIYHRDIQELDQLFSECERDWACFLCESKLERLAKEIAEGEEL